MGKEPIKSHGDLEVYKMAFDVAMFVAQCLQHATRLCRASTKIFELSSYVSGGLSLIK